jgi:ribosomal protein S27E
MGRSVEEYLAAQHDSWDAVLRTARCPDCHCAYSRYQTRERAAWEDGDHARRILVLRIRCPSCTINLTTVFTAFTVNVSRRAGA